MTSRAGGVARRGAVAAALLTVACSRHHDPLSDADHIAGWANASSALGAFLHGYDPLAIADGQMVPVDPACPTLADDGTTLVITGGGCADSEGTAWHGSATVVRGATGGRSVTLDGYVRAPDPNLVAPVTGSVEVTRLEADLHAFTVDVRAEGGIVNETVYEGTVAGGWTGPTVWNGSGTISREGLVIHSGTVEATTVDQVRDADVCPGENVAGTTTMISEEHSVVVTYDGDTACDEEDSARWSRDGVDQGLVAGVACRIGRRGEPGAPLLIVAGAFLVVARRRRRDRQARLHRAATCQDRLHLE